MPSHGSSFALPFKRERGAQRMQQRFGLFDGRVVAGLVDHVQRPAVTDARGLGDR